MTKFMHQYYKKSFLILPFSSILLQIFNKNLLKENFCYLFTYIFGHSLFLLLFIIVDFHQFSFSFHSNANAQIPLRAISIFHSIKIIIWCPKMHSFIFIQQKMFPRSPKYFVEHPKSIVRIVVLVSWQQFCASSNFHGWSHSPPMSLTKNEALAKMKEGKGWGQNNYLHKLFGGRPVENAAQKASQKIFDRAIVRPCVPPPLPTFHLFRLRLLLAHGMDEILGREEFGGKKPWEKFIKLGPLPRRHFPQFLQN